MSTTTLSVNSNQESDGWLSWFTFGYLGSNDTTSGLGRNVPEKFSKDFTKVLSTEKGRNLFVATTPEELQEVRRNLRKVSTIPPAPPAPDFLGAKFTIDSPLRELHLKVKKHPAHDEELVADGFIKAVFNVLGW